MTLTTIGYGDIVPVNRNEHLFVTISMGIGGCVWAYILGSICAAASNLNPQSAEFQRNMDELNRFMVARKMGPDLQQRFRTYFINARENMQEREAQKLLDLLSPALAAECVEQSHASLREVGMFKFVPSDFLVAIISMFEILLFGPSERIALSRTLLVLNRGVLTLEGRLITSDCSHRHWGDDFVLSIPWLQQMQQGFSLTFVEVGALTRTALDGVIKHHPVARKAIRKALVKFCLMRCATALLHAHCATNTRH